LLIFRARGQEEDGNLFWSGPTLCRGQLSLKLSGAMAQQI